MSRRTDWKSDAEQSLHIHEYASTSPEERNVQAAHDDGRTPREFSRIMEFVEGIAWRDWDNLNSQR